MTTQFPYLATRRRGPAATAPDTPRDTVRVQTRLPWWAVALPAVAFAALLALLSAGPADASAAAPTADTLARLAADLGDLLSRLL
ncbi:hypothetical protein [Actinacidiphila sp. ITFR-21]|uniref:hypothetical protein n=1 Tax=Actinacidiphila sp. ITFR-21 TaxID=3075199 RepID=UPI00288B508F|nr:hypothetical protein [Streptomyces sp. ITFR-21]WNI19906.1 hypothetical protein RLT57_04975 [Streptomyces sp. ITFR-21]